MSLSLILAALLLPMPDLSVQAEKLGMLDSPEAYLATCEYSEYLLSKKAMGEIQSFSEDEQGQYYALAGSLSMACAAMARGVGETIGAARDYTTLSGVKMCAERIDIPGLLAEARKLAKEQPDIVHVEGMTTARFLLLAMQRIEDCEE